jgi:periplasmic protein TonB
VALRNRPASCPSHYEWKPVYPESERSAGIDGTVILHAIIGMNGKPLSLRVMNSQIDPELARSALEAVSQWRYTPRSSTENPSKSTPPSW